VIEDIKKEMNQRMGKSLEALIHAFGRIRTGRANPAILEGIVVQYYGADTPLNQVASISVEDARTLLIAPWDRKLVSEIEKALLKSDLGITPKSTSDVIRLPLPPLSEENRRDLAKLAKHEAEQARVAVRNIRRDAIGDVRDLVKEKEIAEDDARRAEEDIQRLTDKRISEIDHALSEKESDLLKI
jgi:ribosome recycling factor